MPIFKTTHNILTTPWEDELWDDNWMDSDTLVLPPKGNWDYKEELTIEKVDIWEQIFYMGGGLALYASWSPYAEFYLITHYHFAIKNNALETFYGPNAGEKAYLRAKELGMDLVRNKIWVDESEMWLYQEPELKANTLILP